jgi:hypothetical protein
MKDLRKNKLSILFKKSNKVAEFSDSEYRQIDKEFSNIIEDRYNDEESGVSIFDSFSEESYEDKKEESYLKKNIEDLEGTLVFGDSQSAGAIGSAISSNRIPFVGYNVKRIKNEVIMNDKLRKAISLAEKIYICGGGNPQPSDAGKDAYNIVEIIRSDLSEAPIVWIAPPPPAFDGSAKGMTRLYKPGMDLYNKTIKGREERAYDIESSLSVFPNVVVVNPFNFITEGGKPGYYCGGSCDGIHAPAKVARKIAQRAINA